MTQENLADDESAAAERGEKALCQDSEGLQAPVRVSWKREADGGATAWVRYFEDAGSRQPYWSIECRLRPDNPRACFPYPPGASEGTLELISGDQEQELRGSLPLSSTNWFHGSIARLPPRPASSASSEDRGWPGEEVPPEEEVWAGAEDLALAAAPAMQAGASAGRVPAAGPETAAPPRRGAAPCAQGWQPGGTIIDNPSRPLEIFRCLWLRPAQTPVVRRRGLGFVFLEHPESLPFYQQLEALRLESDGRAQMMRAAHDFEKDEDPKHKDQRYVRSIADLHTPVTAYPDLVELILKIEGEVSLGQVREPVDTFLFAYGVGPLEDYLASPYFEEIERRVWQTLFAVALGAWDDPRLGDRLVGVLRVDHFLRQLHREIQREHEHKPQRKQTLRTPGGRRTALQASVVLAEGAVPLAPGCTCEAPPSDEGWVRTLGIGDLKRVCQCLLGYQPGEVARVVNVMARERLELSARELLQHHEASAGHQSRVAEEDAGREQTSRSDLRREIGDLIAAETLCSHYNNLSQKYDSSTITLNGTWSGNDCLKERADREARDYAQSLTRRAASRIVDAVAETRVHQRLREHERLSAREVDNRQGSERLVGIYRWLKKLYRLTLEDAGKRLVMELEIADPAHDYLRDVRNEHSIRLKPPPSLARERVFGPDDVKRDNYLFLASLYGLEDPELPPPEQLVRVQRLQAQPPVSETELAMPAGYEVKGAQVACLLGKDTDRLVGYVGGAPFAYTAYSPTASQSLALATSPLATSPLKKSATAALESDEASCEECEDPFSHARAPGIPVQHLIPLTDLVGRTDTTFPVTVLSTASSFFVSVTLTCELLPASGLFEAWQVRTYDALIAAFDRARARYLARLRARITASSAGRERQLERRQLDRAAIAILASLRAGGSEPSPPCSPPHGGSETRYLEFFENAFDWAEMTYAFRPWPSAGEPCGRDPNWRGQAVIDLETDELFKSFLHAHSARVLVPVIPGVELAALYYLLYGLLWSGDAGGVPVAATDVALVADLEASPEAGVAPSWCLEIPTPLRILQAASELPVFECPLAGEPAAAGRQLEAPALEDPEREATGEETEPTATKRS